jgi:hypothetical protein
MEITDGNSLFQRLCCSVANEIIWNNMQLHILIGYLMMQSDDDYIAPHYRTGRKHGIQGYHPGIYLEGLTKLLETC